MLVVAAASLILNQLSDIENLKNELAEKISELTGSHVSIRHAELLISKGLGVSLQDVSLSRSPNSPPDLTAQEIWVDIDLIPLLAQELVIKKMLMRGSSAKVTRNPEGKFNFVGLLGIATPSEVLEENFIKIVKMGLVPQLVIQNGNIEFLDYYQNPSPVPILLTNLNVSIKKPMLSGTFSFLFRGEIVSEQGQAPFTLSGKLQNPSRKFDVSQLLVEGSISADKIALEVFRPYIKFTDVLGKKPIAVSIDSDFSWDPEEHLRVSGAIRYQPFRRNEQSLRSAINSLKGKFDYKINWTGDTLEIKESSFKLGKVSLKMKGQIGKLSSIDPKISFSIKSDGFSVRELEGYPPFEYFPKPAKSFLYLLGTGLIEIRSLDFMGSLSQLYRLEDNSNIALFSGEVKLRKVNWDLPFVKLHRITGTLKFKKGRGNFKVNRASCLSFPKVMITGTVQDIFNRPRGNLSLNGDLTLKEMKKLLIQDVPNKRLHNLLEHFQTISGKGHLKLNFLGTLDDINELDINGQYSFHDGGFKPLTASQHLEALSGKIELKHATLKNNWRKNGKKNASAWIIRFSDLQGKFGRNGFERMQGEIKLGLEKPYFKSSGEIKIFAPELPKWLTGEFRFQETLLNKIEFLDGNLLIKVSGESKNLDLKSQLNPHEVTLQNVSLKYANLSQEISRLKGTLKLSPEEITFEKIDGTYGISPFKIKGKIGPIFDLEISSPSFTVMDAPDLLILRKTGMTGEVAFECHMIGTSNEAYFDTKFDLTKAGYYFEDSFVKGVNLPNILSAKGSWKPGQSAVINKLVYELGHNVFSGSVNIRLGSKPEFTLKLAGKELKPSLLGPHLDFLKTSRAGAIMLDLFIEGNLNAPEHSKFNGSLDFKDVEFLWEGFRYPVLVNAHADLENEKINIVSGLMKASDSKIKFLIKSIFGEKPFFDLAISGIKLDLNDVWPGVLPFEKVRSLLQNSRLYNDGKGSMTINLAQCEFLKLDLKNLDAKIRFKNKTFLVDKINLITPNKNLIKTRGMLTFTDAGKLKVKKIMRAENIEAEDYLEKFGDTFHKGLTGKVKLLHADLEAEGRNLEEFAQTLNGKVSFNLISGTVNTAKLKQGAAILFGDGDLKSTKQKNSKATPYKNISGDFTVKNGIAKTESYLYETPETRTSLVGTFDLIHKKMKTVVGVAPLAALDKFLTQIPLLGKIITGGDEKSLVKAYYTVNGPFASPNIKSTPWTSLEKRVFGTLKAILESPADILTAPLSIGDGS